jgi:hypothetical protein
MWDRIMAGQNHKKKSKRSLEFDVWSLSGAWILEFGASLEGLELGYFSWLFPVRLSGAV